MGLFPGGGEVFEALSRYDDLLTLEGRPGYEPGDTLALIVPFLLRHGTTEAQIVRLARKASLTPGAQELIGRLMGRGWGLLEEVRPVGGRRKVEALRKLVGDTSFEEVVVVGDSITDFPLFRAVGEVGGLAVAFNANQYALPYATLGLAGESLLPLEGVLLVWEEGGREGVRAFGEAGGEKGLHWLA